MSGAGAGPGALCVLVSLPSSVAALALLAFTSPPISSAMQNIEKEQKCPAFTHTCLGCHKPLRDDCTYCSLRCKVRQQGLQRG